jgi:hypothetical protein
MNSKYCPIFHKRIVKVNIIFVLYKLKITFKTTSKSGLRSTLNMGKFKLVFSKKNINYV